MKTVWTGIRSRAYWRLAAILTGTYLTLASLGKTGDWWFAGTMASGFYLFWFFGSCAHSRKLMLSKKAGEA